MDASDKTKAEGGYEEGETKWSRGGASSSSGVFCARPIAPARALALTFALTHFFHAHTHALALTDTVQVHYTGPDGKACAKGAAGAVMHESGGAAAKGASPPRWCPRSSGVFCARPMAPARAPA